jgi:hypothetical protein
MSYKLWVIFFDDEKKSDFGVIFGVFLGVEKVNGVRKWM